MEHETLGAKIVKEGGKFFRIDPENGEKEEVEFISGRGWYSEKDKETERELVLHSTI